jgi:hypothetical protein
MKSAHGSYFIVVGYQTLTLVVTTRDLYGTLAKQGLPNTLPSSTQLLEASAPLMSNSATERPLARQDYPKVRFWFKQDWADHLKEEGGITKLDKHATRGKRSVPGENVSMRYIENESGVVIDGYRATEMRKFARSIWNHLANSSKAPKTWGKADVQAARHYRLEMCSRFPELRLCGYDWKVDQIATDNYPNWVLNRLGPSAAPMKQEDGDSQLSQPKRRQLSPEPGPQSKKRRNGSPMSSTTPPIVSAPPTSIPRNSHPTSNDPDNNHESGTNAQAPNESAISTFTSTPPCKDSESAHVPSFRLPLANDTSIMDNAGNDDPKWDSEGYRTFSESANPALKIDTPTGNIPDIDMVSIIPISVSAMHPHRRHVTY